MRHKILFFLLIIPFFLLAQQKQPKVGLVLSGGGAKGFAHVGILKEIEKAGIQLDYIGGTSMGAIVGGMFASGYTADQIEEIILSLDFMKMMQDKNPRASVSFFEKENGEKHVLSLPVEKGKIGLPKGFSKGQNLLSLITALMSAATDETDFSKLPIPFFCIATDVETGGQILLEKGSLPLSMRASSSFPTLLTPVEIDGKLLIDGGVANNFPADILKGKGMDIIIGVNVEGRLYEKEKLTSAIAILNQIVSYKMYGKSGDQKKYIDVFIKPDLENFNVVDFGKSKEILQKGKEESLKFTTILKEIAAKQVSKHTVKRSLIIDEQKFITSINIEGLQNYTRAYVLGKLNIKVGDYISNQEISEQISHLTATRNFKQVEYRLESADEDAAGVKLFLKIQGSNDNASLRFGLHYDFIYKSSVLINYNHKKILTKNDVFSLNLIVGDNVRYDLNYFIDNGFYTSFGFRSSFNHFRTNARFSQEVTSSINLNKIDLSYTDFTNQLFVQTTFNRKFAVGFGAEIKRLNVSTETVIDTNGDGVVFEKSNFVNLFSYLKLDTYNKKYFPTKGFFADILFKWYFWSDRNSNLDKLVEESAEFSKFSQLKGKLGFATSLKDKLTFQFIGESGLTIDAPTDFGSFDFILGGYNQNYVNTIVPLYGYEFADLTGKSFVKSEIHARYEFSEGHYAMLIANYARLEDNIFNTIDIFKELKSGYAVGYSLDTGIGPIELKYSWSPDNNKNYVLFNLGFWF